MKNETKYHRGNGEVVVPEKTIDDYRNWFTYGKYIESLPASNTYKCDPAEPIGWLQGYEERYEVLWHRFSGGYFWGDTTKSHYDIAAVADRRIFLVKPVAVPATKDALPYLEGGKWNEKYDQNKLCKCGHPYYRHFDTYEEMMSIGCKYCPCMKFKPLADGEKPIDYNEQLYHADENNEQDELWIGVLKIFSQHMPSKGIYIDRAAIDYIKEQGYHLSRISKND